MDDDPPETDYNFRTKGSGFITAKVTLQTVISNMKSDLCAV